MTTDTLAKSRLHLSPPHMGEEERAFVQEAFDTNWIAPVGPHLTAFEAEMCAATGAAASVCVSSGTAALHLAVRLLGVGPGDEVVCPTFTFVASASPVVHQGAVPVFLDCEQATWNLDPDLLAEFLRERAKRGKLPRAVIVADIYGQPAQWDEIAAAVAPYDIPVIEDAAEAAGATYRGRWAGVFGALGFYSFNGNKIINTSGGGMLVGPEPRIIDHARKLATQAREPAIHYEHCEIGYNYRMSNVLAGIGRGQLRSLPARLARRREIFAAYREGLADLPGVAFLPELPDTRSNRWLTCLTIDPAQAGTDRDALLAALAADDIEGRPLWKPLHAQPALATAPRVRGDVAERLFAQGLSLPSGSAMTAADIGRVVDVVRSCFPCVS